MLAGFPVGSQQALLLNRIDDAGFEDMGKLHFEGDLDLRAACTASFRYFFGCDWVIGLHVPVYSLHMKNICYTDCTNINLDNGSVIKNELTNDFANNLAVLGNDLSLTDWTRTGFGDTTVLLEWFRDFPQARPFLKNARVHWFAGLGFPTGKREDVQYLQALPFGANGAFTIPFGLSLDLTLGRYFKAGFALNFIHTFGASRCHRILTTSCGPELFKLPVIEAYQDTGLTQRFNLYFEFYRIMHGLSVKLGYQFIKKGEDSLSFSDPRFNNMVANTAQSLQESVMHQMLVWARYEFGQHMPDAPLRPTLGLFARVPFKGRNAVLFRTIGLSLTVDF